MDTLSCSVVMLFGVLGHMESGDSNSIRSGQDYNSYGLTKADDSDKDTKFSRTCSLL